MAWNGHIPWGVLVSCTVPSVDNGLLQLSTEMTEMNSELLSRLGSADEHRSENSTSRLIVPLHDELVRIGRMRSNNVTILNPCISSVHCSLFIMRFRGIHRTVKPGCNSQSEDRETEKEYLSSEYYNKQESNDDASETEEVVVVLFSDHSRNGCLVNSRSVGKGKYIALRSHDIISLIDAGRHKKDYNVSFQFFTWAYFTSYHQVCMQPSLPPARVFATTAIGQKRKQQLLLLSRWIATARTRRMYSHSVEDFYILDKTALLGEGGFGKVYRAALRLSPFLLEEHLNHAQLLRTSLHEEDEENLQLQKERFIENRKMIPSCDVIQAAKRAAECLLGGPQNRNQRDTETHRKRLRESTGEDEAPRAEAKDALSTSLCYTFAVKIIQKQRLGIEGEGSFYGVLGTKRVPISAKERMGIMKLRQLDTPIEFYEHEWKKKQFRQEIDIASLSFSQEPHISQINDVGMERVSYIPKERDQQRSEILSGLSPEVRELYKKERRAAERHRREVDILISLRHPNIVRLYEAFDSANELALVMELATGGEVWDLLQPPKRVEVKMEEKLSIPRGVATEYQIGAPLPEFIVKIIITQVLRALEYLHSMGVIHRDLKLENLVLKTPISLRQLVAQQCAMLQRKITALVSKQNEIHSFFEDHGTQFSCTNTSTKRQCNPLSPLYTVHLPPPLWPVVQVTDFGLSNIIKDEGEQNEPDEQKKNGKTNVYNKFVLDTSCGTRSYSAPEVIHKAFRVKKGYSASADIFSVGVIAFALLTNRLPYPHEKSTGIINYNGSLCFKRARMVNNLSGGDNHATSCLPLPELATVPFVNPDKSREYSSTDKEVRLEVGSSEMSSRVLSEWEKDCLFTGLQHVKKNGQNQSVVAANSCIRDMNHLREVLKTFTANPNSALDLDALFKPHIVDDQTKGNGSSSSQMILCDVSPLGIEFLSSLLALDPEKRLGATEALKHPWLRECVDVADM